MQYKIYTDEKLIQEFRAGNSDIADYIIKKYKPLVRKKTNAMYLIGGENEDLIQEGMIGLFKAVRDYDETKECKFSSFAELCINRQLYSALEASNRKKHIPLNTYISFSNQENSDRASLEEQLSKKSISPEEMMIEEECRMEFEKQLQNKLSLMEKKVLDLYLEGNSYIQIAQQMGKTIKSIDNSLQRIRGKIKLLKEEMETDV
ncbi:MAG: sigma-70 family RNA polymerase sigma factor [Lachnospiraceae bacterium]|nr:sigma-70 family RNA polymerase sigma factor [Lachnospiraceae bacterium]